MKTGKISPNRNDGHISIRAGQRTTKTHAKTARACGYNYTPTSGWRVRSQGTKSTKMVRSGQVKAMKVQAKSTVSGDAKKQ